MKIKDLIVTKSKSMIAYLTEKGFFLLLGVNLFSQLFSFITSLLVAKFLTPAEYGNLKVLQTYINIFVLVATFGFSSSVLKLCSEQRDEEERQAILQIALKRAGISTLGTVVLAVVLSSANLITSTTFLSKWLIIYTAIVPIDVFTSLLTVYLQSGKKIKKLAIAQAIFRIQSVPLILLGTWKWGFAGFIISSIISHLIGLWPFLRYLGFDFLKKIKMRMPAQMMNYAILSFLSQVLNQVSQNGDILILDHFSNNRAGIGFYSLALLFILAASLITQTVKSITTPYFSEHANDEHWFRIQLRTNRRRMAFFSIAVAVAVLVFGYLVIPLLYGESYRPAITYLSVLLIAYVLRSFAAVTSSAITGLGKMKFTFLNSLITAPIELVLTYFALHFFGFIGVAWSQVAVALIVLILTSVFGQLALKQQFG